MIVYEVWHDETHNFVCAFYQRSDAERFIEQNWPDTGDHFSIYQADDWDDFDGVIGTPAQP